MATQNDEIKVKSFNNEERNRLTAKKLCSRFTLQVLAACQVEHESRLRCGLSASIGANYITSAH